MTISIRNLVNAHDNCKAFYEGVTNVVNTWTDNGNAGRGIVGVKSATVDFAPRTQPKYYRQPTSLWGRLTVALSGAAARRERACARLNTYHSKDSENPINREFSNVAMLKFIKAYDECDNRLQKSAMMQSLDVDARAAAETALGWGRR
ncbi:hypothetical protein [Duganella qianjiadongensis]|uniref:Uncharacterized protein n=1 Tax=Duganella qianjiadongensis TaxID=2692176 RepID=A0ABW9VS53_9BURK|nr:hypothetical protein [Duganella qianjiadongensis]MYM40847.1 hypothetical protein [Duganella qianjiadongensis]